jgi:hypothetical protein
VRGYPAKNNMLCRKTVFKASRRPGSHLTEYEELSDSEEESLTEQDNSKMQEFIELAMTKMADLDNGEI